MKAEDWVALVLMIAIIAIAIAVPIVLIDRVLNQNKVNNQCVVNGYAGQILLADRYYCYKLNSDGTGELLQYSKLEVK